MEVQLHTFITSALDVGEQSVSCSDYISLGRHSIKGRGSPKASLDMMAKRKICCDWESNPDRSA